MDKKILLFIPMYNCEKQITRVLGQIDNTVTPFISEVIVVNNRSTDGGEATAVEYCKAHPELPVKILRNDENYGLGGSHKVAFQYAIAHNFDYVIVLHGDDQGSIRDVLPLIESGDYQNYDCCLGGRFLRQSQLIGYSRFRTFGNHVFNIIFSLSTGKRIFDLGAGLNMYAVDILKTSFYKHYPDNLTFNCYMLFGMSVHGHIHTFFPIMWREEDQISNVKMTKQAWQTLKMAVGFFFQRDKFLEKDARVHKFDAYTSSVVYERNT